MKFGELAQGQRNHFDFLRFLFATLVILAHSWMLLQWRPYPEPLALLSGFRINLGILSVGGFFCISGFLITQSWERSRSLVAYFRKRVLRIYPGWIAAVLFCVLVVDPISKGGPHWDTRNSGTWAFCWQLMLHDGPVILPGVFTHNPFPYWVNGSLWTIRFEILCYLLVAAIGVFSVSRRPWIAATVLLSTVLYTLWPGTMQTPGWGNRPLSLPWLGNVTPGPALAVPFLCGACLYLFRDRIPRSSVLAVLCLALLGVMAWGPHLGRLWPLWPVPFSYLVIYVAFSRGFSILQNWAKHGDLSYGVYLYAFPVQQLICQHWAHMLNPYTLFLISWLVACGMAMLSWHLIEKPFLRLKPKPQEATAAVPGDSSLHEAGSAALSPAP